MLENNIAIKIQGLTKSYNINLSKLDFDSALFTEIAIFLKRLLNTNKNTKHKQLKTSFSALDNISLNIKRGEKVGIIGRNGAGKSTLLKILSRITYPDKGYIEIHGKIASLLEIGTGFHPDLSGRENIYLNGTLLGMTRRDIDEKLNDIIDFSGISTFLDSPIKKYSSGMKVRLAFAVAAHLTSEILIVDEVLAVGDVVFQQKCIEKMNEIAREGRTVLFVSHNMSAVRNLCERAIYLKNGKVIADGEVDDVVKQYLNENHSQDNYIDKDSLDTIVERIPSNAVRSLILSELKVLSADFEPRTEFSSDEEIHISLGIEIVKDLFDLRISVSLTDEENNKILTSQISDTELITKTSTKTTCGMYSALCIIPANLLGNNKYFITVNLINPFVEQLVYSKALSFKVNFKGYNNVQLYSFGNSYIRPKLKWEFLDIPVSIINDKQFYLH